MSTVRYVRQDNRCELCGRETDDLRDVVTELPPLKSGGRPREAALHVCGVHPDGPPVCTPRAKMAPETSKRQPQRERLFW